MYAVLLAFAAGWVVAIVHSVSTGAPRPGLARVMANPLSPDAPVPAPYLFDAALRRLAEATNFGGTSGDVRVVVVEPGEDPVLPDSLEGDVSIEYVTADGDSVVPGDSAPPPGIWNVLLRTRGAVRRVPDLTVLSMVPLSEKRSGRIGEYLIGTWPNETGGTPRSEAYRAPRGLVRVTPENLDVPVSRHFLLRHFLTKGQENVWPKYVLVSPRLLDKLELTIDELNRSGTPVQRVGVISGFRTPSYNAGGGNTAGRGALSRHMYGDAMDWFVDNDGDGRMDDLNGDGTVDVDDGRVMIEAGERVEAQHPDLVGGLGLYAPTGAHAGFVHTDTRGYRARW
ncbi:MAG TPA: hypothetical protein VHG09_14945 [Longimicrobiales bacterium]|nr:hypothetical protein [Longimicrobiales bacterium]